MNHDHIEFDRLWNKTIEKIRAYVFCYCGRANDLDDLVQECYLRALKSWDQFNGTGSRQAWLFTIAYRTCVDWSRCNARHPSTVSLENVEETACFQKHEEDAMAFLWGSIQRLNADHRHVIMMRFTAALSYAEMALALDVPIGTVRSRLHRALKNLKKQVKDTDYET